MNFELKSLDASGCAAEKCDALLVVVPEGFQAGSDALSGWIAQARKAGDLDSKAGKSLALYKPQGLAATRVMLCSVGEGSARQVRQAVVGGVGALRTAKRLVLCCAGPWTEATLRAAIAAVADASYVYTATKSKPEARVLATVVVAVADVREARAAFDQAVGTVAGIELAKEWGNRPGNHATPTLLANAAKTLARYPRIKCEVLGPREVAKLGMGSFMSVAQGSEEPLRFIVLRYDGAARTVAPTVLVGKGITFDTGGISIKPAGEMDEMKFDMCGAASVLGVFRALAEIKPAINVVGLIPAAENMPDGRAVKPGDVVTSMSGQTIEILNTDAEGRLVLCDALSYAERFKPRAVIDIATLTGACVVALGGVRSGLFSNDETLANALLAAGEGALDPCWRLPLDDDYADGLKTNFADVANVAGRAGGAVTAAKFLQRFAGTRPWAHLDIAGTAWKGGTAKGSTGRPVGLLLGYLLGDTATGAPPVQPTPKRKAAAKPVPAKSAPARKRRAAA
ncbi:leucyl aminopeptidase [Pseudorhodoferax sp. Leaf267]|uniref:leucyl aminopeptidase n=1 Tax=Pseudorhodoferax sp. Leaf267 TaxID=1736316 RepID=UPI0006FA840B|nr:leucyl aminopeptidase [Pseudorhodoferax sp. Leaf267]KQP15061.1 aminopeptidase [Pseudorhodoferax sp. Leaf267]